METSSIDAAIREFRPNQGDWRSLETLFTQAFASSDPKRFYDAIFHLFERYAQEDASGVFWSALHGMEAVGGYEELLVRRFKSAPSFMTRVMLRRILNAGQTHIGELAISGLIE